MEPPQNLVFLRHGQSEVNYLRKVGAGQSGLLEEQATEILGRPDWQQRLSATGRLQAKLASRTVVELYGGLDYFDKLLVSPYIRARETAAIISEVDSDDTSWSINTYLAERSWGSDAGFLQDDKSRRESNVNKLPKRSPWLSRFDNGESMLDVIYRTQTFLSQLSSSGHENVLVVGHEGVMNAARYLIEHDTPEEWERCESLGRRAIRNATILHFTRVNPQDNSEVHATYGWRRMIYPDKPLDASPNGGEWLQIRGSGNYSAADLRLQISRVKPILD